MPRSKILVCILCCSLGLLTKAASAQTPVVAQQTCSPAMLDVSALPSPPSTLYGGHLFVVEVQNISSTACSLPSPQVFLLPTSDTNNQPFYAAWRPSDPGYKVESRPQLLEPAAWAHVLFAWTSRAGPELDCDLYSELRLGFSYQWQQQNEPGVQIRHLWIRACGPFAVTGYRLGRYSSASPVPQSWLKWYGAGGLKDLTISRPTPSEEIERTSPLLVLSAQAKRTMLGDRLFSLKLKFPRLAAEGCAFSQLRKRESDGSTVISLQQCEEVTLKEGASPPPVPWYHEPGMMGLPMGNLDFTPKHFGSLEYDITAPIGRDPGSVTGIQYGRTRVDLVVHDPALPRQVAILDPLPACTLTQLRVVSPSPVISSATKTLRAYNATNISSQACSLAGVPRTRGLDDKGKYQPFLPPACPNCESEFFQPQPNGRIDLKEGETAHLLAGATGTGTGFCTTTRMFEFSLNRDASLTEPLNTAPLPEQTNQSATVPFEGQDCISIDVSAWRQGPFDSDPLGLRRQKLPSSSPLVPAPRLSSECNKPELLAHGRPQHIQGTHDPVYGLSMEKDMFVRDEPVPLFLWTDNTSDHAIDRDTCGEPAYLKSGGFVLYDAYGHRMLNKRQLASDTQCKADPLHFYDPLICTSSFSYTLPAHTCSNSRIDLTRDYELPPGHYTVSTRDPGDGPHCPRRTTAPYSPDQTTDITFTVLQP